MRKDEQYFPLEKDMISENNMVALIDAYGAEGFGTYILILTELRRSADYRCNLIGIKGMARKCKIEDAALKKVLYGFGLFEVTRKGKSVIISSPYLDRVMEKYEKKVEQLARIRMKGYNNSTRGADGKFTANGGILDKIRLDKNISTTTVVAKDAVVVAGSWEAYLDEAVKDEAWMELLAMSSGFSRQFIGHTPFVVETFRRHIALQGSGTTILSVSDVKAYFANFLRPGTPTQKRVAALLAEREELHRQTSANRYETLDPVTGERTYFGNPIPPDAPPRPDDNAVWSSEIRQWI